MSEDSKLKAKAKKILLGVGITTLVGSGLFGAKKYQEHLDNKTDNEIANKEWKNKYANADSIFADAEEARFYAVKNIDKEKFESLAAQDMAIKKKIKDIAQGWEQRTLDNNNALYGAAKNKNAKQYLSTLATMKDKGIYVDYGKEVEGISLNDVLQANAQGNDARWISINRKHEQTRGKRNLNDLFFNDHKEEIVPLCERKGDAFSFVGERSTILSHGRPQENKTMYSDKNVKNFTLQEILDKSPTSFEELKSQLYMLRGVSVLLQGEMREAEGYEIDVNAQGKVVKKTRMSDGKIVEDTKKYESDDSPFRDDMFPDEELDGKEVKAGLLKKYQQQKSPGR